MENTAESTSVLRAVLICFPLTKSALNVAWARVYSALAASYATLADARSAWAVDAALAVATFTPGTAAVAKAVVVKVLAVAAARITFISQAL